MSTLTTHYQFILPQVNNAVDENIWGGQLNTDWTNNDTYIYAINKGNIGTSQPTIPATAAPSTGMTWIDSTANPWIIKIFDGTTWVGTGTLNTVDHIYSNMGNLAVNVQTFPTAGAYTYTPSVGMAFCIVECIGGGGGAGVASTGAGCSASAGGGGGGYVKQVYSATTIGASRALVIGAAGAAGSGSGPGSTGGTTSFSNLLTVTGGHGGAGSVATTGFQLSFGGAGGTVTGPAGYLSVAGSPGGNGISQSSGVATPFASGGPGGGTALGGIISGPQLIVGASVGNPGVNGSGGAGGAGVASGAGGGAGGDGLIIITEYI